MSPSDTEDDSHLVQLTHVEEAELEDEGTATSTVDIDPLSDESLKALRTLAKYKPPPDPYPYPEGRAAVMVALFGSRSGKNLNVLLSTRSESLRSYPGQVACPGGKMDRTDLNLEATARREAFEEVGMPISPERVRYLTTLPPFLARSLILVSPVVFFVLDYSLKPELNPSEVSSVFSLPLSMFLHKSPAADINRSSIDPSAAAFETPFYSWSDYHWFEDLPHRFHAFSTAPQPVTGLTASILIAVAKLAYGRDPDFQECAKNQIERSELCERAMQEEVWRRRREEWEKGEGSEGKSKL